MTTYIAHPKTKVQAAALKAIFKALQVPFETASDNTTSPYNAEFVAKILADKAAGKFEIIKTDNLWK